MDGSRHFKSNSSGWAFIIYKNGKVFHQDFGEVPVIFEHQYEQFAFSQLMKFVMQKDISSIQIYTDALNLKNSIDKVGHWMPEALKYEPTLVEKQIDLKTVLALNLSTNKLENISINHIKNEKESSELIINENIPEEHWSEAKNRLEIITPLLNKQTTKDEIEDIAIKNNL